MKKVLKILFAKFVLLIGLHVLSLLQFHFKENFSAKDFEFPLEQGADVLAPKRAVAKKALVSSSNEQEEDPGSLPPSSEELEQNCQNLTNADPLVRDILKKRFYYMSMGQHMTVFIDSNKQYVLKLFNPMEPLRDEWYQEAKNWKAFSHPKKIYEDWLERHTRVESKLLEVEKEVSSEQNPSGIIYLHKNNNKELPQTVTIVDKYGYEQVLELEKTPFLIQKYAVPLKARVKTLAAQGKKKELNDLKKKFERFFVEQAGACLEGYLKDLAEDFGLSFDDIPMQIGSAGKRAAKNATKGQERDSYLAKAMQILSTMIDDALDKENSGPLDEEESPATSAQVNTPISEEVVSKEQKDPIEKEDPSSDQSV